MAQINDRELALRIISLTDALERLNDSVGTTSIRHQISEYVVRIRLLARDGHLRNMNGGRGPGKIVDFSDSLPDDYEV